MEGRREFFAVESKKDVFLCVIYWSWTRKFETEDSINILLVDDIFWHFESESMEGRREGILCGRKQTDSKKDVFLCQGRNESSFSRANETRWITEKWSAPFPEKKGEKICKYQMLRTRGRKSFFLSNAPTTTIFQRPKYIQSRLSFITFHFIPPRQSVALCFAVGTNSSGSGSSTF